MKRWVPKFDGDAPPNWKEGMGWISLYDDREKHLWEPAWLKDTKYDVEIGALVNSKSHGNNLD